MQEKQAKKTNRLGNDPNKFRAGRKGLGGKEVQILKDRLGYGNQNTRLFGGE